MVFSALMPDRTLMGVISFWFGSIDISKIRRKEIVSQNIRRQNHRMQSALDLIEQREIDVKPLLTHTFYFLIVLQRLGEWPTIAMM